MSETVVLAIVVAVVGFCVTAALCDIRNAIRDHTLLLRDHSQSLRAEMRESRNAPANRVPNCVYNTPAKSSDFKQPSSQV